VVFLIRVQLVLLEQDLAHWASQQATQTALHQCSVKFEFSVLVNECWGCQKTLFEPVSLYCTERGTDPKA
jgi:hypothetical protein